MITTNNQTCNYMQHLQTQEAFRLQLGDQAGAKMYAQKQRNHKANCPTCNPQAATAEWLNEASALFGVQIEGVK